MRLTAAHYPEKVFEIEKMIKDASTQVQNNQGMKIRNVKYDLTISTEIKKGG